MEHLQGECFQPFSDTSPDMTGEMSYNHHVPVSDASAATTGEEYSRKRQRLEPIVESHVILGQSSHYRQAEYRDQGDSNEEVYLAAQQSFVSNQDGQGVGQLLAVNAHIGSVQHEQYTHSAFLHTTTEPSNAICRNIHSEQISAGQVCFGMVRTFTSCCFLHLVAIEC